MSEDKSKRNRTGLATIVCMPPMALFFDLLSIIPFLGSIAWVTFTIWFYLLGVSPFNVRRLAVIGTSVIIEMFPKLSLIPSVTIGVIAIIVMVKSEDKLGIKLPLAK